MRAPLFAVALAAGLLAACNAILGIDPPNVIQTTDGALADAGSAGDVVVGDAVTTDVASLDDASARDGEVDPVPAGNLLDNSTFETSCAGGMPEQSTLTPVATAHSGHGACKVCSNGGASTSVYGISWHVAPERLGPGKTYVGAAWIRLPDTSPATALLMPLVVDGVGDGGGASATEVTCVASASSWTQTKNELTLPDAGLGELVFEVINRSADDGCFIVDDVTLAPK